MRFILVLVMFGVMMDVGGLESCFGKIQKEAGVNPDEMQGFIKGLNSEPGGVVSNIGDMANVLTKVQVLTKQGKSAEEVNSSIQSDLESLAADSPTISRHIPQISAAVGSYVDKQDQVRPSSAPAEKCLTSFKLNNTQKQNFSTLPGLSNDNTAKLILPQIPTNQLHCIPGSKMIQISPKIIKEVVPGLVSMATSLREAELKSISDGKSKLNEKKKKLETFSSNVDKNWSEFNTAVTPFMADWNTFLTAYCGTTSSEDRETKKTAAEQAARSKANAYKKIFDKMKENLEILNITDVDSYANDDFENKKNKITEIFSNLPKGNLYSADLSTYGCNTSNNREMSNYSNAITEFNATKSDIKGLISTIIGKISTKVSDIELKVEKLQKEINELKTDTDKKS